MKFWICPYCHAHLDIWEKCDCQNEKNDSDEEKNQNDMSAERYAFI